MKVYCAKRKNTFRPYYGSRRRRNEDADGERDLWVSETVDVATVAGSRNDL
jgi:hypothetical protein